MFNNYNKNTNILYNKKITRLINFNINEKIHIKKRAEVPTVH